MAQWGEIAFGKMIGGLAVSSSGTTLRGFVSTRACITSRESSSQRESQTLTASTNTTTTHSHSHRAVHTPLPPPLSQSSSNTTPSWPDLSDTIAFSAARKRDTQALGHGRAPGGYTPFVSFRFVSLRSHTHDAPPQGRSELEGRQVAIAPFARRLELPHPHTLLAFCRRHGHCNLNMEWAEGDRGGDAEVSAPSRWRGGGGRCHVMWTGWRRHRSIEIDSDG